MCRRAQASDGADAEGLGAKSGEYFPAGANSCQRTPAESGPGARHPAAGFVALKPGVADELCACGDEGLADGGDQRAVAGAVDRVAVWAGIVLDDETILRHGELDEDLHRIARRVPAVRHVDADAARDDTVAVAPRYATEPTAAAALTSHAVAGAVRWGTTRTARPAWCSTRSATLPRRRRPTRGRPCEPTTIKSAR